MVDPYRPLRDDPDLELVLRDGPRLKPGFRTYDVIVHERVRLERIYKIAAETAEEAGALVMAEDPRARVHRRGHDTVELLSCEVKRVVGPMPVTAWQRGEKGDPS